MFTPFHKPPYTYPYGRSVDETTTEPQEKGIMSTVANFPSVRNQGMSNPGKSQTPEGDAD
jgi:hypothetical protein